MGTECSSVHHKMPLGTQPGWPLLTTSKLGCVIATNSVWDVFAGLRHCSVCTDHSKCLWKRPYLTGGGLSASQFEMGQCAALDPAEKITTWNQQRDLWKQTWGYEPLLKVLKCLTLIFLSYTQLHWVPYSQSDSAFLNECTIIKLGIFKEFTPFWETKAVPFNA